MDDHDLIRLSVCAALGTVEDFDVVGCCRDGADAVEVAARSRPDVVVMDLRMPGMGGLAATRLILAGEPRTRVVVLTAGPDGASDALAAGASAFVGKTNGLDALITAVRGD